MSADPVIERSGGGGGGGGREGGWERGRDRELLQ